MNKMVCQSMQPVSYIPNEPDTNIVQCSYNIQEGQKVTGKTSYYQDAAGKSFKAGNQARPAAAGTESPEGVLDSALPKAATTDPAGKAEPGTEEPPPKKATGRKRRQRRRKHKNKNKDKEGDVEPEEDQFLDENFDENDEDFQQIYVADNAGQTKAAGPEYFDDNQQQIVDDLNYCMEMEMDQNDINERNHDLMEMQMQ